MLEFDNIILPLVEWSKSAFEVETRFAMTTNGTLFTRKRLDFLKENNISFMLSMDGARTAQLCNRPLASGANIFNTVMEHVPYILELWPMQSFRETLTEHNAGSLFEDIMFFDSIGCKNLMIVPDVFKPWSAEKVEVLASQIAQYEDYILTEFRAERRPFLTHEYAMGFKRIAAVTESKGQTRRSFNRCAGCQKCGFGVKGSASIAPNGDIYGCHHISPLNHESIFYLGDVWHGVDEGRVKRLVDSYDPQKVGGEKCRSCPIDWICDGGCAPNNYQINGDLHEVPEMYCTWTRLMTDSAYRIAFTLGAEKNELFQATFTDGISKGW